MALSGDQLTLGAAGTEPCSTLKTPARKFGSRKPFAPQENPFPASRTAPKEPEPPHALPGDGSGKAAGSQLNPTVTIFTIE